MSVTNSQADPWSTYSEVTGEGIEIVNKIDRATLAAPLSCVDVRTN